MSLAKLHTSHHGGLDLSSFFQNFYPSFFLMALSPGNGANFIFVTMANCPLIVKLRKYECNH